MTDRTISHSRARKTAVFTGSKKTTPRRAIAPGTSEGMTSMVSGSFFGQCTALRDGAVRFEGTGRIVLPMTYWGFHGVFMLPAIGALLLLHRGIGGPTPPRALLALGLIAGLALFYTAPWDQHLIARGAWSYEPDRVSVAWRLGNIPLEEVCFFVLQPVLTGLCLLCFLREGRDLPACEAAVPGSWIPRVAGGALALLAGLAGAGALAAGGRWLYLGLILAWSAPPLALHWFYGGDALWRARRVLGASLTLATVYLWAADRAAIAAGIWIVSPLHSTGWKPRGLPVEEAVFFLVTNLLVLQGMFLFLRWIKLRPAPLPA